MTELITASRLSAARRCAMYEFLTYQEGYRPLKTSAPLHFGTLVHKALEAWWKALTARLDEQEPLARAFATIRDATENPYERVRLEEIMRGYHYRWKEEPLKVLAVETQFKVPIVHPYTGEKRDGWELAGKLDVIVQDLRDGRFLLIEHKSSGEDISPGSRYWLRLRLDGQLSVYAIGARSLFPIDGTIYDVLFKHPYVTPRLKTEKPRYKKDGTLYANQRDTDESPDEYRARLIEAIIADPEKSYQRGEVHRLQSEIEEATLDLWSELDRIEADRVSGHHPRNVTGCDRYGSLCHFHGVCSGTDVLNNQQLFQRITEQHPELSQEA